MMKILIGIYLQAHQGIPPQRYDTKFEAQRSQYPINRIANGKLSKTIIDFYISLYSVHTRKIIEVALKSKKWNKAMEKNLWEICNLPRRKQQGAGEYSQLTILLQMGVLKKHKARILAKGYTQTYRVDYSEIFPSGKH